MILDRAPRQFDYLPEHAELLDRPLSVVIILISTLVAAAITLRWPVVGVVVASNAFLFDALTGAAGGASSLGGILLPGVVLGTVFCLALTGSALARYVPDITDVVVSSIFLLSLASSMYAEVQMASVVYSFRLLLVGMSSYFAIKIAFSMCSAASVAVRQFFVGNVICAAFFGTAALIFGISTHSYEMRLTLGDNSHIALSMTLGLGFISGMVLVITQRLKLSGLLLMVGILALIGYAMLLANTRSVLLGIVLAGVVAFMVRPAGVFSRAGRKVVLLTVMAVAGLAAIVVRRFDLVERAFGGIAGTAYGSLDASELERLVLWNRALEDFLGKPFTGRGAGMFEYANDMYPHNIFLEVGAGLGLPGLILLTALLGLTFWRCVRRSTPQMRALMVVFVYVAFIAQASLALWMHKMLFISIGMISAAVVALARETRASAEASLSQQC